MPPTLSSEWSLDSRGPVLPPLATGFNVSFVGRLSHVPSPHVLALGAPKTSHLDKGARTPVSSFPNMTWHLAGRTVSSDSRTMSQQAGQPQSAVQRPNVLHMEL